MFDTSLVKTRASSARYRLFTASIAVHTAVIIGALGLSVASVDFPKQAPDQMETLGTVSPPPPLGSGGPPRQQPPRPKVNPVVTPTPVLKTDVAPDPNAVPADPQPVTDTAAPSDGGGEPGDDEGTGDGGDPNGIIGGTGTEPGGSLIAGPSTDVVHRPGGEVRPARVLTRVEPRYPPAFVRTRVAATVKIRCIIDRNGKVRDAEIVTSSFPPFNESVIDALHRWTFAPGTMRGVAVDTYFELTVRFETKG